LLTEFRFIGGCLWLVQSLPYSLPGSPSALRRLRPQLQIQWNPYEQN